MQQGDDTPAPNPLAAPPAWRGPRRARLVGLLLLAVAALALGVVLLAELPVSEWLATLPTQLANLGAWAPVVILGLFYALTVAALPTPLLVAASGATLGLWGGFLGIWAGYMLAVGTVWVVSRWLAEPVRARFIRLHPQAEHLLAALSRRGGWLVFLTQLHPMSPNGVFNWLYPSLGIKARQALPAIGIGRAPTLWLYTALGAWSMEGMTSTENGWWWLLSALIAVAILVAIGQLVSRALRETLEVGSSG